MELSFVLPAYNVEKYITNTLYSLLNQTIRDFEVIIVNDGSTDDTHSLVNKFIMENKLINYRLIDQKNSGVSSARNTGFYEAKGNYVIFLDGDDFVSNVLVENILGNLGQQKQDIFCWGYNTIKEDKTTITSYFDKYKSNLTSMTGIIALQNIILEKKMKIWTGSAAYRREFLLRNKLVFTEGCSNGEDQEFIIKSLFKAEIVVFINSTLSFYVQREGSISNSYNIRRFDVVNAMRRTYEYIKDSNDGRVEKISRVIKYDVMLENYLYNFNSCISYLFVKGSISTKKALININNDIDKNFPKLNELIISIMKSYRGNNKKLLRRIKLFLYFPSFYYGLIKWKYKQK